MPPFAFCIYVYGCVFVCVNMAVGVGANFMHFVLTIRTVYRLNVDCMSFWKTKIENGRDGWEYMHTPPYNIYGGKRK